VFELSPDVSLDQVRVTHVADAKLDAKIKVFVYFKLYVMLG
jgi:hypothetical protein